MGKLKLNLEDLKIESFVTTPSSTPAPQGTIQAYSTIIIEATNCVCECSVSNTCTGPVSLCPGDTCNNTDCATNPCTC